VQEGLRALEVPFEVAPRLVRGLDYYRRTKFKYATDPKPEPATELSDDS
jgi:histidyl-tRNA synthetase